MSLSDNFCSTKQKGCYCSYGVASSDTLYYYGDYFYYLEKSELEYVVTDSNNDSLTHNISVRSNEREIKLKKKYQFKLIFCRLNMIPKIIVFPLFINHTKEYFYITVDSFVLEK